MRKNSSPQIKNDNDMLKKKRHFTFRKFSSINILSTSFVRLLPFNSLYFVGFEFHFLEVEFSFLMISAFHFLH